MMSRRAQRSSARRPRNIDRIISNKIRSMHLNQSATWHLNKTRSFDPPPYVEDVIYQRKVRLAINVTQAVAATVNAGGLLSAAGLSAGSFSYLSILRVDAYGSASAGNAIRINTYIISADQIIPDRDFTDYGVQGSRRPHISVAISPKDQGFVSTAQTAPIFEFSTLDVGGGLSAGSAILDFLVQFKNSNVAQRAKKSVSFNLAEPLPESGSNPGDTDDQHGWQDLPDSGESDKAHLWSDVPQTT